MDKLKPVAWKCEVKTPKGGTHKTVTMHEDVVATYKRNTKAEITPLYALPEGYAIVPVSLSGDKLINSDMYNYAIGDDASYLQDMYKASIEAGIKAAQEEG